MNRREMIRNLIVGGVGVGIGALSSFSREPPKNDEKEIIIGDFTKPVKIYGATIEMMSKATKDAFDKYETEKELTALSFNFPSSFKTTLYVQGKVKIE